LFCWKFFYWWKGCTRKYYKNFGGLISHYERPKIKKCNVKNIVISNIYKLRLGGGICGGGSSINNDSYIENCFVENIQLIDFNNVS